MIYLDNAATSFPKPQIVLRAMNGTAEKLGANPGRSGHRMSLAAGRIIANCREVIADMLHVNTPERIIFCLNCTDAVNLAIHGLLQPGDHAICNAMDHNAVLRPLHGLARKGMITLDVLYPDTSGTIDALQVQNALKSNTRLIVCTHASNVTGAIQPIAQIGKLCKQHSVPFLVDAAQTMGILPVYPDEICADMIAFPGHKALLGPMGTGVLWIRKGIDLSPIREGGTGSVSESVYQPEELPDRYESGTLNLIGIAGLLQGVRFVQKRREEIREHELSLVNYFDMGLSNLSHVTSYVPQKDHVGVASFNIRGMLSGEVAEILDQRGFGVRAGLHCAPLAHKTIGTLDTGAVRVSPGLFNCKGDIDRLLDVINRMSR